MRGSPRAALTFTAAFFVTDFFFSLFLWCLGWDPGLCAGLVRLCPWAAPSPASLWVTVCNPDKDQHVSHSEVSRDQGSLPKCYVHFTVERGEECATLNSVTLRLPRAPVPPPFASDRVRGSFTSLGIIVVVIVSVYFPVLPVSPRTEEEPLISCRLV